MLFIIGGNAIVSPTGLVLVRSSKPAFLQGIREQDSLPCIAFYFDQIDPTFALLRFYLSTSFATRNREEEIW